MFFIISSNDIPHNISSEVYLSILLTKKTDIFAIHDFFLLICDMLTISKGY